MYDIVTLGLPIVEFIRNGKDFAFDEKGVFSGPFASGDTAIFIDVAARLGNKCAYVGVIGTDEFGDLVEKRLRNDGVDTSMMRRADTNTGINFLVYFSNGSRKYLSAYQESAASLLGPSDLALDRLTKTKWVHLTGVLPSLNKNSKKAVETLLASIDSGTKVSFDPNVRVEVMTNDDIDYIKHLVNRADVVFPSEGEARSILGTATDDEACRVLCSQGKTIVLKLGEKGCRIYHDKEIIDVPAFKVEVVDETGCGDSFCAGFITGLQRGLPLSECGVLANAVGALQSTVLGPMEGAKWHSDVAAFIESNR